jgi:hypothetical protein
MKLLLIILMVALPAMAQTVNPEERVSSALPDNAIYRASEEAPKFPFVHATYNNW